MSILTQKTISKKVSIKGIGIHTGLEAHLDILPAQPNTGIIFKRVDLKKNNIIIPTYNNVVDATLCTTISNDYGIKVFDTCTLNITNCNFTDNTTLGFGMIGELTNIELSYSNFWNNGDDILENCPG